MKKDIFVVLPIESFRLHITLFFFFFFEEAKVSTFMNLSDMYRNVFPSYDGLFLFRIQSSSIQPPEAVLYTTALHHPCVFLLFDERKHLPLSRRQT